MTEYSNDSKQSIVRPSTTKKHEPFAYCKWAAGDWEARFYTHTDAHIASRDATIKSMQNDPCWFKRKVKVDAKQAMKNNKAKGTKQSRRK